jgi:small subunit ribosomal protein S17
MKRKLRKNKIGIVVSNKMLKTIIVVESKKLQHDRYLGNILKSKRYTVHDEQNNCNIGDLVKFMETRPLSKTKKWILTDILHQ